VVVEKIRQGILKKIPLLIAAGFGLIVSIVILPLMIVSINNVVKNGEIKLTEFEVSRVENLIQEELDRTSRTLGDWSSWNDTYQFALDGNQDYVENNLFEDTFINLDINSVLVVNSSNQIIYSKYFDAFTQTFADFPFDFSSLLAAYPQLSDMNNPDGYKGLLYFQGHVMIITSNPILTSVNEGPPQGNIIFIKMLDNQRIANLSRITLRSFGIFSTDSLPKDSPTIPEPMILKNDVHVYPKNINTIVGYKYLSDLNNEPTIVLQVENPRDLFLQGRTTKSIVITVLMGLILILSITTYYFSNNLLIARELREKEETKAKLLESTRLNAIELEKRVIERTRELEIKNKDMETFNYTVSHDLKSPLRGISGYSTLLVKEHADQLNAQGKVYLQNIIDAAQRMDLLIQDLLSYTKANRNEIVKTTVDLEMLFDSLLFECGEDISKRDISVIKNLECKHLLVDLDGITLILRNLLDNAVKFTKNSPHPEIVFSCKEGQNNVIVSVADNGVGFDLQFHDKIFNIFQRLHLSEDYPGTGIGLALVKKTMERLGGRVYAESQLGVGSTFYLEIPQ
jgi:signal transduction histidine kinase